MARLFGTDGVRGIANRDLSCELAFKIGLAGAQVLTSSTHHPRIFIGCDTRLSCDMLSSALQAGICSVGAQTVHVGVLPTPGIAHLTKVHGADAGVVISASHNSFEYNGIKWFSGDGYKLSDELEDEIEAIINDAAKRAELPTGKDVGHMAAQAGFIEEYIAHLVSLGGRLDGMTIVLDCANGAASAVAPEVFKQLGAKVHAYFCQPDGININDGCGSTHPGKLQQLVAKHGADAGLAFDGDADRLIAVDEKGALVDGDRIMAVCAMDMQRRGKLSRDTVVVTVMSNLGMKIALKEAGIQTVETAVGDRYVLERMRSEGYNFGGEQSGHMIFLDESTTGDGVLSGVKLLDVLKRSGKELSALAGAVPIYPQVLINVEVPNASKQAALEDAAVLERIAQAERRMEGKGRVLVRTSGTEPLVRVMLEGEDAQAIREEALEISRLVAQRFEGKIRE